MQHAEHSEHSGPSVVRWLAVFSILPSDEARKRRAEDLEVFFSPKKEVGGLSLEIPRARLRRHHPTSDPAEKSQRKKRTGLVDFKQRHSVAPSNFLAWHDIKAPIEKTKRSAIAAKSDGTGRPEGGSDVPNRRV